MSILVYAESWEGKFRKSTFEAVSYAKKLSQLLETNVKSISIGNNSNSYNLIFENDIRHCVSSR